VVPVDVADQRPIGVGGDQVADSVFKHLNVHARRVSSHDSKARSGIMRSVDAVGKVALRTYMDNDCPKGWARLAAPAGLQRAG
jgi:hypothetical protein